MSADDFSAAAVRAALWRFLRDTATLIASIGVILMGARTVLDPWVAPWVAVPSQITELVVKTEIMGERVRVLEDQARLSAIAPVVQFRYAARASPGRVRAGDDLRIVYQLRRNLPCPLAVTVRVWSLAEGNYLPETVRNITAVPPPMTRDYQPWVLRYTVPATLAPGTYAYQPEMTCTGHGAEALPLAFFEVVE